MSIQRLWKSTKAALFGLSPTKSTSNILDRFNGTVEASSEMTGLLDDKIRFLLNKSPNEPLNFFIEAWVDHSSPLIAIQVELQI
jgi:hypothetical protein